MRIYSCGSPHKIQTIALGSAAVYSCKHLKKTQPFINPFCLHCLKLVFRAWPELCLTGSEGGKKTQEEVSPARPHSGTKHAARSAAGPPHAPCERYPGGGSGHGCSASFQRHQHHGLTQQHLPEQSTDSPRDRGDGKRKGHKYGERECGLGRNKEAGWWRK